jgi:hypothetical protein
MTWHHTSSLAIGQKAHIGPNPFTPRGRADSFPTKDGGRTPRAFHLRACGPIVGTFNSTNNFDCWIASDWEPSCRLIVVGVGCGNES